MIPDVLQTENASKGKFYVAINGKELAQMTYSKAGEQLIIIDHTEVDETLRGQEVGRKMVEAAVRYAREKGIRIMPLCPFARSVFEKQPELRDVL